MASSTEARELQLCEKVEMRIALAKEDKLEGLLNTYLPPLLLKLASEFPSVRQKVVSICSHVKIRLAGNQAIVLPVEKLLLQYKSTDNAMIRHFDLLFIQGSIRKLTDTEQINLIPIVIHGLAKDVGKSTCATVFNLFLRLLPLLKLPPRGSKEDVELRKQLKLEEHAADAKFLALWFSKLTLFTVIRSTASGIACPGLTVPEYEFLTLNGKQEAWDPTSSEGLNLTQTKIAVLAFLASGAFTDEERFLPALFASGDSNSRISNLGDDMLKRSDISLEDPELIASLLQLYFTLKPALQIRVLTILAKSSVSTTFGQQIINVVQQAIQPDDNTNLPAKGLETVKFRNALFNYMNWVSRIASPKDIKNIAPQLVEFLRSYIEDQGWPIPHENSTDAASLRALAYETLGSLAKTTPSIARNKDLSLVRWLFRSLTEEGSSDAIVSIEGALSSLLNVFAAPLDDELKYELRHLLLRYMTLSEDEEGITRSARFSAVRWANRCLEYSDIVGRWIDILALGGRIDERSDVMEEGKKGLDPYWYRLLTASTSDCPIPDWAELVKVIFSSQSILENSAASNSMRTGMDVDSVSVSRNFSGPKINAFASAVTYCRRMLLLGALKESGIPFEIDADWERQLDVLFRSDKQSRKFMKGYIASIDAEALFIFLSAALEGLLRNDGKGLEGCGTSLFDILSLAPKAIVGGLATRAAELLSSVKSNNAATRDIASRVFGILASHPVESSSSVEVLIQSLLLDIKPWESAVGADSNKVHGSILALGALLSRSSYYGRLENIKSSLIKEVIELLIYIVVGARDASMKEAAFITLGELSVSGVLTTFLLPTEPAESAPSDTPLAGKIITLLAKEAKKGNEKAISALGRLTILFDENTESFKSILTALYDLSELKQPEIHFAIGEALSCASAGWESDILLLSLDVDVTYEGRKRRSTSLFDSLMTKLLKDSRTTKPSLKKASGIWLFCQIQHNGHLEEIQSRLRDCQNAFMGLLSARDELVQETASRGLSLVYEQGDESMRKELKAALVASFTGTSAQLKVDEETELFEPGALPTGEGKSVTTYKDIVSLVNESGGDQSLVYKFMSLANNAATWSTRAAFGRFGLSQMLSDTEVDPKLLKTLYRYRFDPNPNVQRSMNDIWNSLLKESKATEFINTHFDDIMSDLLVSILGKEWRTRQASCAALADLVQGREFEKYEKYLSEIWKNAFQVLDDIKGSVRKEALVLSMALTGILVRQVEAGTDSKHAIAMLKQVIPFLLSGQGMQSSAKEVQVFATVTVLKLIKKGGIVLRFACPELIEELIGLLSTLEGEGVEYIRMRAAHYNLTEERIDNVRVSGVSQSPIMEAIEHCLDILDEPTMKKVVPGLENAVKTSLGMPSKIGCSGVLVSLATRHTFVFRPYADSFLKILEKSVLDRNNAVSAGYARATGYLARLASDAALTRLADYSRKLYFEGEDEARRQVAADMVYSVSKFATDRFNAYASAFLPFVFFAKHDFDEHVKEQFEKTWSENVGGSRAVLLYSKEINALAVTKLESPRWTIKHSAALTIADVVTSSGSEISLANATAIWPALEKALGLKTFDGKEIVLEAFVKFTKAGKSLWEQDATIAALMKKIAIREAKRNNEIYRPHAFSSLGAYAEIRVDIDMFDEGFAIISPILEEAVDDDKMDTDEDNESSKTRDSLVTNGLSALFRSVNTKHTDPSPISHLNSLLKISQKIFSSTKLTTTTKMAFYERSKSLFENLRKDASKQSTPNYNLALGFFTLLDIASGSGTETMRLRKGEAAEMIVVAFEDGVFGMGDEEGERGACKGNLRGVMVEGRKGERAVGVGVVFDRVVLLLGG